MASYVVYEGFYRVMSFQLILGTMASYILTVSLRNDLRSFSCDFSRSIPTFDYLIQPLFQFRVPIFSLSSTSYIARFDLYCS